MLYEHPPLLNPWVYGPFPPSDAVEAKVARWEAKVDENKKGTFSYQDMVVLFVNGALANVAARVFPHLVKSGDLERKDFFVRAIFDRHISSADHVRRVAGWGAKVSFDVVTIAMVRFTADERRRVLQFVSGFPAPEPTDVLYTKHICQFIPDAEEASDPYLDGGANLNPFRALLTVALVASLDILVADTKDERETAERRLEAAMGDVEFVYAKSTSKAKTRRLRSRDLNAVFSNGLDTWLSERHSDVVFYQVKRALACGDVVPFEWVKARLSADSVGRLEALIVEVMAPHEPPDEPCKQCGRKRRRSQDSE